MELKFSDTIVRSNTILYCDNFEQTIKFYRDILQLPVHHKNEWLVEFLLFDQTFLSIADEKRTSIKSSKGKGVTISLNVENLDQVHNYFYQQGSTVSDIKPAWEAMAFYIYDPSGNRVEFWT